MLFTVEIGVVAISLNIKIVMIYNKKILTVMLDGNSLNWNESPVVKLLKGVWAKINSCIYLLFFTTQLKSRKTQKFFDPTPQLLYGIIVHKMM